MKANVLPSIHNLTVFKEGVWSVGDMRDAAYNDEYMDYTGGERSCVGPEVVAHERPDGHSIMLADKFLTIENGEGGTNTFIYGYMWVHFDEDRQIVEHGDEYSEASIMGVIARFKNGGAK